MKTSKKRMSAERHSQIQQALNKAFENRRQKLDFTAKEDLAALYDQLEEAKHNIEKTKDIVLKTFENLEYICAQSVISVKHFLYVPSYLECTFKALKSYCKNNEELENFLKTEGAKNKNAAIIEKHQKFLQKHDPIFMSLCPSLAL
jgi:hypothetical protein